MPSQTKRVVWIITLTLCFLGCESKQSAQLVEIAPQADYAAVVQAMERMIKHEMRDKDLPALSIALVDNQETVWAKGFGLADPDSNKPSTAQTIHRVGSISQLFTDIGSMQLVEKGELDLDAAIANYLPGFQRHNPLR